MYGLGSIRTWKVRACTYTVYALKDPRLTGLAAIRYVGSTINRLSDRLKGHLAAAIKGNYPRDVWIRELTAQGFAPTIVELGIAENKRHMGQLEKRAVLAYSDAGCNLLNISLTNAKTPRAQS